MDKKIALSAAGALAMTATAAVSALFLTFGQGATAAPATAPADIVTEYQVVTVDEQALPISNATDVVTIPSAQAEPEPTPSYENDDEAYGDHDDEDHDEDEYGHEEDDDD